MSDYTLAHFAPYIGDGFDVAEAPEACWVLSEATGYGQVTDPARHDAFSLLFRGAPDPVFAQQTVTLVHPAIGEQAIFVTPIAQDAEGVTYQAVFN